MTSKRKTLVAHSRARAMERYGITLGPRTRSEIVNQIRSREAVFLEKRSNRVSVFAVRHEDQWYPVVYDRNRKEIVTFLPRDYLAKYSHDIERHRSGLVE